MTKKTPPQGEEVVADAEFEEIGAEIVEYEGGQVETRQPAAMGGLFHTTDPKEVIQRATAAADALMDVVRQKKLSSNIQGKEYLQVEAWTTLGAMVGISARTEWSRAIVNDEGKVYGYEAAVEVVNAHGVVISRAEAQCTRDERTWANRDNYALRSMAQTRATSKALRMPLGFIAVLAGYEATPMEEMPTQTLRAATGSHVVGSGNIGNPAPRRSSKIEVAPNNDHGALLLLLKDALSKRKEPQWQPEAVVEAGNRQWSTSYADLEDFSVQHLKFVIDALERS